MTDLQSIADYLFEELTKLDAPISYTACLVLARHILGTNETRNRELIDREPDHRQYAKLR